MPRAIGARSAAGQKPASENSRWPFVHQQRRNTAIPDRENDSDTKYQVRDRSGKRHARRLGDSVHPPHAEDIAQYRDEGDEQSGSSEHLRAQIPLSAVVWNEKEGERIEEETSSAVDRDAAWRSPALPALPGCRKEQKIESGFAAPDVLVESEDCDCSNESGECLLDSFRRGRSASDAPRR